MDPSKLTPAESWCPENWDAFTLTWLRSDRGRNDLEFLKLARAAFDVQMRRGWSVDQIRPDGPWMVSGPAWAADPKDREVIGHVVHKDPFTALVEADRFYREHVEDVTPTLPRSTAPASSNPR